MSDLERRLAGVVCGVAASALRAAGAQTLVLIDDGSPEASLCLRWLRDGLPGQGVRPVRVADAVLVESALQPIDPVEAARAVARTLARTMEGLVAGPANRTTLLLAPRSWPDDLLPLGDLWASRVAELAGGWSGPPLVTELAGRFGGVEQLDAALGAWVQGRDIDAAPGPIEELRAALARGRSARRWPRLVPKLENRTAWIDLGR